MRNEKREKRKEVKGPVETVRTGETVYLDKDGKAVKAETEKEKKDESEKR